MKKFNSVILLLLVILFLFCACGNKPETSTTKLNADGPHSMVIVTQYTANSAEPMLSSSEIMNTIYDAVRCNNSNITLIEADGAPYTVDAFSINIDETISQSKKQSIAKQSVNKIVQIAKTAAIPKTAQIDTLKALNMAARNINPEAETKTVIYLGSGLQTTGLLDFATQNLLETDTTLLIEKLKEMKAIPNFPEGTEVIFAGIGDVVAPQTELTYENVETLTSILKGICEAGGAEVKFITTTPLPKSDNASFPEVSTVPVVQKALDISSMKLTTANDPFKFDESTLKFNADSADFADADAPREVLAPIAEALIDNPSFNIIIAGTTASAGDGYSLSLNRAEACKSILISMGAKSEQITCLGLGSDKNCFHVEDLDSNGNLIEEYAKRNRAIYIFSADSDVAKQCMVKV